ncbi:MAG: hydroxysqualene dehydroxylase HpnE, partial [Burkholderiaceae bacterium]
TPLERASAQIFANVLRDSLGAASSASEMWLPRVDLSALFPDVVHRFIVARGGEARTDARVERITRRDRFELRLRNDPQHVIEADAVVDRRPFELFYPDGFRFRAARLPAPWHLAAGLLTSRGFSRADRAALIGFLRKLKRAQWNIGNDRSTIDWLYECEQTPDVIRRLWRPLALAALNTPLERASAQIFANVLRDSLGAASNASEMWLPRVDLSALLPDAVHRFIVARGGEVRTDARVERITRRDRFELRLRNDPQQVIEADAVVYAASPAHLEHIVGPNPAFASDYEATARFEYEPIYTVYLKYEPTVRLARDFFALLDDPAKRRYAQWVFDRGALDSRNAGIMAAIISASGPHEAESLDDVGAAVARQLSDDLNLPAPLDNRAIAERRATCAATVDLRRPANRTPWNGFALAGDWTESEYPSTLETAVRSGVAAARLVMTGIVCRLQ